MEIEKTNVYILSISWVNNIMKFTTISTENRTRCFEQLLQHISPYLRNISFSLKNFQKNFLKSTGLPGNLFGRALKSPPKPGVNTPSNLSTFTAAGAPLALPSAELK